jgi:hypothetical protein
MKNRPAVAVSVLIVLVVLTPIVHSWCAEYVMMRGDRINIRTGPGLDRAVVAQAAKGDMFEMVGEAGDWYEILLFSGDHRFVHKFWALEIGDPDSLPGINMDLPRSAGTRRSLFLDIYFAEARAWDQADEIIPPSADRERNRHFRRILEDEAILTVMDIYEVQPLLYWDLMEEAIAKNW